MPDPQRNVFRPRRASTVSLTVGEWQRVHALLRRLRQLALNVTRNPAYDGTAQARDARETVRVIRRVLFFIERDVPETKPRKPGATP